MKEHDFQFIWLLSIVVGLLIREMGIASALFIVVMNGALCFALYAAVSYLETRKRAK